MAKVAKMSKIEGLAALATLYRRSGIHQNICPSKMQVVISKSTRAGRKYQATANNKTVHFGAVGYESYIDHKDPKRKSSYISRHSNEDHSRANIMSPAFMSRWVLWEKPSKKSAIANLNRKYKGVKFILQ